MCCLLGPYLQRDRDGFGTAGTQTVIPHPELGFHHIAEVVVNGHHAKVLTHFHVELRFCHYSQIFGFHCNHKKGDGLRIHSVITIVSLVYIWIHPAIIILNPCNTLFD